MTVYVLEEGVGEVVSIVDELKGVGNVGLALCRLEIMTDIVLPGETAAPAYNPEDEFTLQHKLGDDSEDLSVKIKAFVPDWLRQGLDTH